MTLDVPGLSLRELTSCGGCAAKAVASLLKLLRSAAYGQQGIDTLVGLAAPDDAAVTAINETTSLITTVDFFPPVVSDAFEYGYVSALNSLSDIYAMGGLAKTALLVCGFPKEISDEDISACVSGAALACKEAGVEILGGHTVRIAEPIFGLAATGGAPGRVEIPSAVTTTAVNRNSLVFIWFPPKHMWSIEFAKILSLDRKFEYSSPEFMAVDNYAAPFRQASKLTAASDDDQTDGGTLWRSAMSSS